MDQTEKIPHHYHHQNQLPTQNNPESQKNIQKLSQNLQNPLPVDSMTKNQRSQNGSLKASQSLSQTGSQMDQKIMSELSKKQKRRYTSFLEALGIPPPQSHKKKQEEPNYVAQEPIFQEIKPNTIINMLDNSLSTPINTASVSEYPLPFENLAKSEDNFLAENKSREEIIQGEYSQIDFNGNNKENIQSQCVYSGQLKDNLPSNQYSSSNIFKKSTVNINEQFPLNLQHNKFNEHNKNKLNSQENNEKNNLNQYQKIQQVQNNLNTNENRQQTQIPYQPQKMQIDSQYQNSYKQHDSKANCAHQNVHINHSPQQTTQQRQHEQGEIIVNNKYDILSNSNIISEINYDMISSIYTPVSQFKVPKNPSEICLDQNSNQFSNQNELVTVMQQIKQVVKDQKDIEIDGPSHRNQVEQQNRPSKQNQTENPDINNQQNPSNYLQQRCSPMEIQTQEAPALHVIEEMELQNKFSGRQNQAEVSQSNNLPSFLDVSASVNPYKSQSEQNGKNNSGFPKSKKNSFSMAVQNSETNKTAQNHTNRRKFSESSRSAGLSSVNNKITSSRKPYEIANGIYQSFLNSQDESREYPSFQESSLQILQVDQQHPLQQTLKMTPNGNSFSNRSQKSMSIKSKRSNRFSEEDVNERQVPQLDSLQMVKDGKEPRLQRRSRSSDHSNHSHHSRSASTCKKSYQDLSEIHMQKIDQKACEQLQDKSIKRSIHHSINIPSLTIEEAQNERLQLENEFSQAVQDKEVIYVQGQEIQIDRNFEDQSNNSKHFQKKNQTYSIETNYVRPFQENKNQEKIQNFTHTVSHQISYHFEKEKEQYDSQQFDNKSIQCHVFSEASNKTTQSQQIRQNNQLLLNQIKVKKQKLRQVSVFQLIIDKPIPIIQRINKSLLLCKQFFQSGHHHSNYERQKFKSILDNNFQFFGFELQPITDLGDRILHDGIFACSFINFVKADRNSGMLESLMYTQFDQEVGIRTNKDFFIEQFKRVKEERQMHYNNQFQKRLKDYEDKKAKEQALRMQMTKNVINQTIKQREQSKQQISTKNIQQNSQQKKQIISQQPKTNPLGAWVSQVILQESNTSVADSSETMTIDDKKESQISPIRKSTIADLAPKTNQSIVEDSQDLFVSFGLQSDNITTTVPVQDDKKHETKKSDKIKKRVTKKKQKKVQILPTIIVKSEQDQSSADETVSQILPLSDNKQKNITEIVDIHKTTDQLKSKHKPTKGILKAARNLKDKDEPSNKEKKQKRSPSKVQIQRLSKKKKQQISKEKSKDLSNSKQTTTNRSRLTTDIEQSNPTSETRSPSHQISLHKAVNQKVNQGKIVKFTHSTKGGQSSPYKQRKNAKMNDAHTQSQSEESQPEKRTLRSRSKK